MSKEYLEKSVAFVESIGIKVEPRTLEGNTFLPGLELGPDTIYVDYYKLKYPGDLLHEAGHIAVTSAEERKLIGTPQMADTWPSQGDEVVAILWSYAAAYHLQLPLDFIFHPHGYRKASDWFITNFSNGTYMGLPLLQWLGLAHSDAEVSAGQPAFPVMKNWMRL